MLHQLGFVNDTNTLIYIDGTSITNQALSMDAQSISFGSGVTMSDGYLNIPASSDGRITTTAVAGGYGGSLSAWTMDFYFEASASTLYINGNTDYANAWVITGSGNQELVQRSTSTSFGVTYIPATLIGLSLQYDNGTLHIWNKGVYVKQVTMSFTNASGLSFGIGCDGWNGNYSNYISRLKLFRFSNVARYTPGSDFEIPDEYKQ